jgi:hypothetical protein
MPAKTPADIEAEIDQALRRCRSLAAEGLWRRMRFLMEYKSDRKPYARLNGSPILPEQLPEWAGCSAEALTRGLPRLMENGLIVASSEGYYSKPLQRILEARAAIARRVGRHRALRNAQQGVTSVLRNAAVTPRPPPPVSSPPITPSSSSPTPTNQPTRAHAEAAGRPAGTPGDEPLDEEIRRFIGGHPMLDWHPKAHAACRKLVESVGWERAKSYVQGAISKGASMPIPFALGMAAKDLKAASGADTAEAGGGPKQGFRERDREKAREAIRLGVKAASGV